ncbi:hypothetical protein CDI09_06795 [Komagataeibacter nataicola]|uniref:Uncharacterized protein n=1 Tax=Komagataeibacter nataicola TaxID=265960 RepID=A0ABX5PFQ7_9PROT|nr:hypothetical protein CDI09_06795 [Komagataeibacter nataicola]
MTSNARKPNTPALPPNAAACGRSRLEVVNTAVCTIMTSDRLRAGERERAEPILTTAFSMPSPEPASRRSARSMP